MTVQDIDISHPDKRLFPDSKISKQQVADYYQRIADMLLPYVKERPLTLRHFPDGIDHSGFYNKHAPDHYPDFVPRIKVPMHSENRTMEMVAADSAEALIYFAGQNMIELHMSLSVQGSLEKPDQMIFDLDPSDDDFDKVRQAARELKQLLDQRQWPAFLKTTGSRGLHIHVPLRAQNSFDEVKKAARAVAEELVERCPELATLEQRKNQRGDKVFIDTLRNDYGMTAIVPFSLRAIEGAPVATPLNWEELQYRQLGPRRYRLQNLFRRLAQKKDPWQDFRRHAIKLS